MKIDTEITASEKKTLKKHFPNKDEYSDALDKYQVYKQCINPFDGGLLECPLSLKNFVKQFKTYRENYLKVHPKQDTSIPFNVRSFGGGHPAREAFRADYVQLLDMIAARRKEFKHPCKKYLQYEKKMQKALLKAQEIFHEYEQFGDEVIPCMERYYVNNYLKNLGMICFDNAFQKMSKED